MNMRATISQAAVLTWLALSVGCQTTAPAKEVSDGPVAADYYPLAVGNTWTYRLTPAPAGQETESVRIVGKDQTGFYVDNRGGKIAPRTDGLFDGQRFLLTNPIEEGRTWLAVPSVTQTENYRIAAVGVVASVPAGNFGDCVEVESAMEVVHPQTHQKGKLFTRWTYAKGTGLVLLRQEFQSGADPKKEVTRMELVAFQPGSAS